MAESLRDVNSRILQAVTSEQREIFTSSALDDYLLDAERDARRRAQAIVARDEPSLEPFLPRRGEGVVLSASDIDTYRTCPLKYKFARVFRIPQEPTLHQRFGILVHQVLERFHARDAAHPARAARPARRRLAARRLRRLRGGAPAARQGDRVADALPRALPVRGVRAGLVRAPVHLQARQASAARARRPGRPAPGRRVRADRLQDRPAQEPRAARRRRAAVAVRGRRPRGVAARGLAAGLLLPARRPEGRGARATSATAASGSARWPPRSPRGSCRRASSRRRRFRPARSVTTGSCARLPNAEAAAIGAAIVSRHMAAGAARLDGLGTTIFTEMTALAQRTGAINLGQGFPDADGPIGGDRGGRAGAARRARTSTRRCPACRPARGGVRASAPLLRARARGRAGHVRRHRGDRGGACSRLCDPGDEVVVLEPYYDSYAAMIAFAGATRRPVTLRPPDFALDVDELRAAIGPRARVMLVNSPAQPDRARAQPRPSSRRSPRRASSTTWCA